MGGGPGEGGPGGGRSGGGALKGGASKGGASKGGGLERVWSLKPRKVPRRVGHRRVGPPKGWDESGFGMKAVR